MATQCVDALARLRGPDHDGRVLGAGGDAAPVVRESQHPDLVHVALEHTSLRVREPVAAAHVVFQERKVLAGCVVEETLLLLVLDGLREQCVQPALRHHQRWRHKRLNLFVRKKRRSNHERRVRTQNHRRGDNSSKYSNLVEDGASGIACGPLPASLARNFCGVRAHHDACRQHVNSLAVVMQKMSVSRCGLF